jgi:hypothetical protein
MVVLVFGGVSEIDGQHPPECHVSNPAVFYDITKTGTYLGVPPSTCKVVVSIANTAADPACIEDTGLLSCGLVGTFPKQGYAASHIPNGARFTSWGYSLNYGCISPAPAVETHYSDSVRIEFEHFKDIVSPTTCPPDDQTPILVNVGYSGAVKVIVDDARAKQALAIGCDASETDVEVTFSAAVASGMSAQAAGTFTLGLSLTGPAVGISIPYQVGGGTQTVASLVRQGNGNDSEPGTFETLTFSFNAENYHACDGWIVGDAESDSRISLSRQEATIRMSCENICVRVDGPKILQRYRRP